MDGASGGSVIDAGRQLARRLPRLRKRGGIFSTHGIGKPTRCTTSTTGESPAAPIMDQRRLFRPEPLSIRVGAHAALVKAMPRSIVIAPHREIMPTGGGGEGASSASRGHHECARALRHHSSAASWCRYGALLGRLLRRDWNLRRLRVAQGLSQERLALAAGIRPCLCRTGRARFGERDDLDARGDGPGVVGAGGAPARRAGWRG